MLLETLYSIDYAFSGCVHLKSDNMETLFNYVFENQIQGYITSFEGCTTLEINMQERIRIEKDQLLTNVRRIFYYIKFL